MKAFAFLKRGWFSNCVLGTCAAVIAFARITRAEDVRPILVGLWAGHAVSVTVSGNYAFVGASGGGLSVIDVANPAQPTEVGNYLTVGLIGEIVITGQRAYLAVGKGTSGVPGEGLLVLDVSNPAAPQRIGDYAPGGVVSQLVIDGDRAYALIPSQFNGADWVAGDGFVILDISDPSQLTRIGGYNSDGLSGALAVSGSYAYVGGLVLDLSDPKQPERIESAEGIQATDIVLSGQRAYAAGYYGLRVYDLSDPTAPAVVGQAGPGEVMQSAQLAVEADRAYLTDYSDRSLMIFDVSDPTHPRGIGGYFGCMQDVAVSNGHAYIADCDGLLVLDVSNPANPPAAGELDLGGYVEAIAASGSYAYVAAGKTGLQVIDVSNPTGPRRVGGYDTAGWARDVALSGTHLFLTDRRTWDDEAGRYVDGEGLVVLDISEPASPRRIGAYDSDGDATEVVVAGKYAFLTDDDVQSFDQPVAGEGLVVLDVSDPATPQRVGDLELDFYDRQGTRTLAVSGRYVYLANCGALRVIDCSDPAAPKEVGTFTPGGCVFGVAVQGSYALVADWDTGLHLLDISDPTQPVRVGGYRLRGWGFDAIIDDGIARVANGTGLWLLDITNPAEPRPVGGYSSTWIATSVAVTGSKTLLAAGDQGLVTLESLPFFRSIVSQGNTVCLTWEGPAGTRLQSAAAFSNPQWEDIDGPPEAKQCVLPREPERRFFRLLQPGADQQ